MRWKSFNWLQFPLGLLLMASLWACGDEGSVAPTVAVNLSLLTDARQAHNSSIPSRLVAWIHEWLPSVTLASAQSIEEISSIQVQISGPGIPVPASTTVSVSNPTSAGVIPVSIQAPTGPNRTIVVSAFNAATPPRRIFGGTLSGLSLTPGPPVNLEIVLVPVFTVTVQKQGIGTVTSTPVGVDCGTTCFGEFEQGTVVSLNAVTAPDSVFVGWGGGPCKGAVVPTCTVVLNANQTVKASFTIPKTQWKLQFVDSEETLGFNGRAINGFDGATETIWHTQFINGLPPHPHEIQINLGSSVNLNGFMYVPRQDGFPDGRIGQYEFYVSTDGVNWGSPVAAGSFANDAATKQVSFTPTTGQYVRLRALSEVNGEPYTSMAELQVLTTTAE